ncbi:MAG: spermidine/putrescine ABC transporter substrate-binding protein [Meiothermus sp.]|uniref:polyamine ABC transporter substrate-binding protein n=1 Tax=Meiothermus sp. TaxID=1955249 RepID=UPI0021DDE273|nr:spermidine/putrescine ABC transporter substrate-binding protein [Meiothermus sp.]GIW27524.1 MAG: spermidine/putrescine ABC transporter substrate-binding protein [Meiothermus sp.]
MNRVWLVVLLGLLVAGCGQQKKELRLLNWSDYMPKEVLEEFEKREGIKVVEDTYDSPEAMLSKLQAGGDAEYDVLITPDYTVGSLARAGSLQELDKAKIPNLKNLDPQFTDPAFDPGGRYSVVYQWGTTGLAYREDLAQGPVESWAVLFDPAKQVGRFLLLDEMREMVGAALKYIGESVNTTDPDKLAQAQRLLLEAKRRSQGFAGGTSIRDRLIAGDIAVGPAYSGDILAAQAENPQLKYVIPVEGATLWTDNLVVLKKSPNHELAYKFINFLLEPEIAAQISNSIGYATPVVAAMDQIEEKDNPIIYPSPEIRARLELLADLGDQADAFNKVWSEVKSR